LNNSSGFNAFPEGYRYYSGSFNDEGNNAFFLSSTEVYTYYAWNRYLNYNSNFLNGNGSDYVKRFGFSVRFVRD